VLELVQLHFGHLLLISYAAEEAHRLRMAQSPVGDVLAKCFCAAAGFRRRLLHQTGSSGRRRVPPGKGRKAAAGSTGMCKCVCKHRRAWMMPSLTVGSGLWRCSVHRRSIDISPTRVAVALRSSLRDSQRSHSLATSGPPYFPSIPNAQAPSHACHSPLLPLVTRAATSRWLAPAPQIAEL